MIINWDALTACATLALAIATFVMAYWTRKAIIQSMKSEQRVNTPIVLFEFLRNENFSENYEGSQGLYIQDDKLTGHPAILLFGKLRNISAAPAIQCRVSLIPDGTSYETCEIHDIALSSGIAPGEVSPTIEKIISIEDIDENRLQDTPIGKIFIHGIDRLFRLPIPSNSDYPFSLEFRFTNIYGKEYRTVYRMKLVSKNSGKSYAEMYFCNTGPVSIECTNKNTFICRLAKLSVFRVLKLYRK